MLYIQNNLDVLSAQQTLITSTSFFFFFLGTGDLRYWVQVLGQVQGHGVLKVSFHFIPCKSNSIGEPYVNFLLFQLVGILHLLYLDNGVVMLL